MAVKNLKFEPVQISFKILFSRSLNNLISALYNPQKHSSLPNSPILRYLQTILKISSPKISLHKVQF